MTTPIMGLAGGIGAGKSTVARLLAELGAEVVDSDQMARSVLESAEVRDVLVDWWGTDILDDAGRVSRSRVAKIVFQDEAERHRLEELIHPRVAAQRDEVIERVRREAGVPLIVLDTPLLIESGSDEMCNCVVFVEADDAVRRQRVITTRGWTEAEWRRRENSQNALDEKRRRADHTIVNNSGDPDQLRPAVQALFRQVKQDNPMNR